MHILKRNFTELPSGLLVSKPEQINPTGVYAKALSVGQPIGLHRTNVIRDGKELGWQANFNLVPAVGRNYLLNSSMPSAETSVSRITDWYIAPFKNAYTPLDADTMADLASYGELTEYDEAARVEWVLNGASTASLVSNSSAPAQFTINASVSANGAIIASGVAKSETASTMLSAANYSPARSLVSGDILLIQYDLSMTSV